MLDKLFGPKWMNEGTVKDYCEKNGISKTQLKRAMSEFTHSVAGEVILRALADYKQHTVREMQEVPPDSPGYDRVMAVHAFKLTMPDWIKKLIFNLQGFKESEEKTSTKKDLKSNYI